MNIEIQVPWPVSVNAAYRAVSGRMVLSERGRKYKDQVRKVCLQAGWHNLAIMEPCRVTIALETPRPLSIDVDNPAKLLLDALELAGVIVNDKWIYSLTLCKEKGVSKRCSVFIEWGKGNDD